MVSVLEKREEGTIERGYRGFMGGECKLEGEGGGRGVDRGSSLEGEEGSWAECRVVGGQGIQTEVQASYQSPLALG